MVKAVKALAFEDNCAGDSLDSKNQSAPFHLLVITAFPVEQNPVMRYAFNGRVYDFHRAERLH